MTDEARLALRARNAKKSARIKKDISETFATASGRNTLRFIMDICGYQKSSITADPNTGEIFMDGTLHNEARRNLYLVLRSYVHRETLIAVENRGLEVDEIDEDDPLFA